MVRSLRLVCVLSSAFALDAQMNRISLLRGEIRGSIPADAQVELQACQGGGPTETSNVSSNGSFELRNFSPGCYRVSVVSLTSGRKLHESMADIGTGTMSLELRTRSEASAERPAQGVISVHRKSTPAPKKARKAFQEAGKASDAGDRELAIVKLKQAIEIHPNFAEAHSNLGTQYVRTGRVALALVEFEEARRLDDSSPVVWTNYAAALFDSKRLTEGEVALREALRRDPGYAPAHYLLGNLAVRRNDLREARRRLEIAAETMPVARRALERIMSIAPVR